MFQFHYQVLYLIFGIDPSSIILIEGKDCELSTFCARCRSNKPLLNWISVQEGSLLFQTQAMKWNSRLNWHQESLKSTRHLRGSSIQEQCFIIHHFIILPKKKKEKRFKHLKLEIHLLNYSLLVVISQGSAQFLIIHSPLSFQESPSLRHLARVFQFKLSAFLVTPSNQWAAAIFCQ